MNLLYGISGDREGWGVRNLYYFRQAIWSALMISSAINTMMILVENGPSLSLMSIENDEEFFIISHNLNGYENISNLLMKCALRNMMMSFC